ncbi:acetolactate synthase [Clostridia bacterium]|nr:acetolactate synthase [Clostridia bacterium]
MKVSDFVVSFVESQKVKDVFLLAGGGIMHLLDSLAKNDAIRKYYNLHEQASGFCADGYALYTGKPGVCFVTTGPGGTNTITAVTSSYIDSTPVVYFSGQVRTDTITTIPGVRQTGAQEADIISIVTPITKYAVTVLKADDIRYHLEKAFFIATHERPGPVWIEIPLDVQSAEIDPAELDGFDAPVEGFIKSTAPRSSQMEELLVELKKAKRPVILVGSGVRLANSEEALRAFVRETGIPVVSSRRMRDILKDDDERFYFGCVGSLADRYANYVVQNSDLLLSIGSGLRYYLTAYNDANFAPNAKRFIVNIAEPELEKLHMDGAVLIAADAKEFLLAALEKLKYPLPDWSVWIKYCNSMKKKYPSAGVWSPEDSNAVNPYQVAHLIGEFMGDGDVLVTSPSAFAYVFSIPRIQKSQRVISHIGLGSMGTALPEAIGACVASGACTIVCEGDGSLQHNIQELATVRRYNLPLKIVVDSNAGYRQIHTMQNTHFKGRLAGCDEESGIIFPDLKLLSDAYGLKYARIDTEDIAEDAIRDMLSNPEPMIVEMMTPMDVEYLPVMKSKMDANGVMSTPSLELLFPFLPDEEHAENMKISNED